MKKGIKRVLVVDDDPALINLLAMVLNESQMDVVTAVNAEKAVDLLREDRSIDLIITDVFMPGMGGIELSKRVQSSFPIVMMSAHDFTEISDRIEEYCDAYIHKSYVPDNVFEACNKAYDRWHYAKRIMAA